jgi:hypothetical protein
MQLQPARRVCICACNCNHLAVPVSAHATATSSQRIGSRSASCASQRIASHPVQRSAPRECNQLAAPVSAHANATSSPRPPHPPHGEHLAPAALHALRSTLRWFRFVRGTNFSKIQFKHIVNCNFVMCS